MGLVETKESILDDNAQDVFKLSPTIDLFLVDGTNQLILVWDDDEFIRIAAVHWGVWLAELKEAWWSDVDADLDYQVNEFLLYRQGIALHLAAICIRSLFLSIRQLFRWRLDRLGLLFVGSMR